MESRGIAGVGIVGGVAVAVVLEAFSVLGFGFRIWAVRGSGVD